MIVRELVQKIKDYFPEFTEKEKICLHYDDELSNINPYSFLFLNRFGEICEAYLKFLYDESEHTKQFVFDSLNRAIIDVGMTVEAIAFSYLMNSSVGPFILPNKECDDVIGKNIVNLDGMYNNSMYFDIKAFRSLHEIKNEQLNQYRNTNYSFYIYSDIDVDKSAHLSTDDYAKIERIINGNVTQFSFELSPGTILLMKREKNNLILESVFNPYRWCENNYKFILSDSHQFVRSSPFAVIEAFNPECIGCLSMDYRSLFHTLSRRVFFELINNEENIGEYDDKLKGSSFQVKNIIKFLSMIIFLDIKSGKAYVYSNPFAQNPPDVNFVEQYGFDYGVYYDDFKYDNY